MFFSKKLNNSNFNQNTFFKNKTFFVYGLGLTGLSVVNYFKSKKINHFIWDDNPSIRKKFNINKNIVKLIPQILECSDWIIISPGIDIDRAIFKKQLSENLAKIITDIDLFYILYPKIKSIVVTGSNGKSTTCKAIEHIFKNKFDVKLGGNIGKPALSLKIKKNTIAVLEASSYHLYYSKFISPDDAILLNISNDHLDWHKTKNNYLNSKFKIFINQKKNNNAYVNKKKFQQKYRNSKLQGNLTLVSSQSLKEIKNKIKNSFFTTSANIENLSFIYELSKKYNIKKKLFIRYANSFSGLEHRYESFYSKKNLKFINDSKATNFESTKQGLANNKNIYWIVGGLPKKEDNFDLKDVKKNIKKTYIIGKNIQFFKSKIKGIITFSVSKTLDRAVNDIFKDLKKVIDTHEKSTVLLSPAAASFDQFKNFKERGIKFKNLIKENAKKYI